MPRRKGGKRARKGHNPARSAGTGKQGKIGFSDQPTSRTLAANFVLTLDSASDTGRITVNWGDLEGFTELADFFQYFRPTSYKFDIAANPTLNQLMEVALQPLNYIVESPSTNVFDLGDLSTMRGHMTIQPGSNNRGRWTAWPNFTQQLNALDSLLQPACVLLGATSGPNVTLNGVAYVTVSFFRRNPYHLEAREKKVLSNTIAPKTMIAQQTTEITTEKKSLPDSDSVIEGQDTFEPETLLLFEKFLNFLESSRSKNLTQST